MPEKKEKILILDRKYKRIVIFNCTKIQVKENYTTGLLDIESSNIKIENDILYYLTNDNNYLKEHFHPLH